MAHPSKRSRTSTKKSDEEKAVRQAAGFSASFVFKVIQHEGEEELNRPRSSLLFSGVAAGILIAFSVIGEAIFRAYLPDVGWRPLVENLGYSLGFMIVILGRMQLFTENTITTVLPVLNRKDMATLNATLRLWGMVLTANVMGAFIVATFIAYGNAFQPEVMHAIEELSHHATGAPPMIGLAKGIPAGILIASLTWMLSASDRVDSFWIILVFTWLIAAGDFTHIVAGSVEMAFLVVTGELGFNGAVFGFFIPVFFGNVIGGTLVFSLLAYGQVREEMARRK